MKNILILAIIILGLGIIGWYLPKSSVDLAEVEFNGSGQAKAIENETDLWQLYENKDVGFTLKYPYSVSLNNSQEDDLSLRIEVVKIDDLDYPGFDKVDVLKDVQALKDNKFTENSGQYWGLPLSKKIINLGKLNGQEMMVLSRFEVCNVTFERKLLFYINDYQVVVTLKEDKSNIIDNSPQYFELNEENCGIEAIWDFEKQDQFYRDLVAGGGFFTTQEWFDTFDKIVETIEIDEEKVKTYSQLIQGRWTSVDDENSVIEFKDGLKIDFYSGEEVGKAKFGFYDSLSVDENSLESENGQYLVVHSSEGAFEYTVLKLSDSELELSYLSRGNTLRYSR